MVASTVSQNMDTLAQTQIRHSQLTSVLQYAEMPLLFHQKCVMMEFSEMVLDVLMIALALFLSLHVLLLINSQCALLSAGMVIELLTKNVTMGIKTIQMAVQTLARKMLASHVSRMSQECQYVELHVATV